MRMQNQFKRYNANYNLHKIHLHLNKKMTKKQAEAAEVEKNGKDLTILLILRLTANLKRNG